MRNGLEEVSIASSALIAGLSAESHKVFRDGGRRAVTPEQTIARISPFLGQIGVTRVANITGLDRIGIPVVAVCRPNSRSLAVYQGKGATLAAARASGLMESLERYHAEFARVPELVASYESIRKSASAVDVKKLPKREGSTFHADLRRGWIQGINLLDRMPVWVPHEIVHYATAGEFGEDRYFQTSSTGLAAGNSYSEAVLHGMCEAIERDCSTLWRLRNPAVQQLSRIDLASVSDPRCLTLIEKLKAAGLGVAAWETTTEIGVASFVCRIAEPESSGPSPYEFTDAAGCHPSKEVALARAILEAAQGRATAISGARDDLFDDYYEPVGRALAEKLHNDLLSGQCFRSFQHTPSFDGDIIESDVSYVLGKLAAAGIQDVVAVCLTRSDFRIPVVRIIIPELEDGELNDCYSPRGRAIRAYRGRS
ncbi:YcaO-like family protein [Mesorhizobium ventifaucium]|uniref:YcaO-like family protein n=1 Tax=Mesorhizobium ventifaucium TaxID=666020 RepID=UPI0020A7D591|nr:YcaO-like family protein [Mesorhizobium ventifaucium]